ncbi:MULTISPECIES: methyl-accepting chemotaxis protein [unclassified Modicisalibacter]|uniref:methyl-accepting chemotaxis protein n=1 Tax=unclassified Modicisalibacter TaxID=2679913 RepID=UPI001CC9CF65|nr:MULTISPECIES: methyl-accepting chemotaxis protein [unclassified Modicisalibacter]MBZ9558421.1 HAMP domain-containing protein [Modicisalibacter sp. R2A 31.J]MBZ9575687.1 HAMP domain-containing protein [Modicisalibacter sp. MOD 31.J]
MQFKSVRTLVTTLVGSCILLVVVALVGYSMFANSRNQALVDAQTSDLLETSIAERLEAVASDQATRIQSRLEHAMTLARNLASLNAMMAKPDAGGPAPLTLSRDELSEVVRQMVVDNPELLDAFIGWEPDAFGHDALYTGREDQGYGPDGRFMPWWYRTKSGDIEVLALGSGMESQERDDSGIRQGEYYLCPKETRRSCIVDPHLYDYNGKMLLVTSFNAPILVDGEFRGSAGVDLAVDFIQGLLDQANASLYDGAGEMVLIAPRGGITAFTGHADALGKPMAGALGEAAVSRVQQAQSGDSVYTTTDGDVVLYWPFEVAGIDKPWVLMVRLPQSAVMAGLNDLQAQLGAQRHASMLGMIAVGLAIAGVGLLASWLLGGRIARPLRQLAERMRDIASGGGDLTQRLPVRGRDETADVATQFNAFAEKMHDVLVEVRDSSDSVRVASAEIATGSQDLSARTESAASSIQESSASMEELTSTVEHTADSARQADQLAASASDVATRGGQVVSEVVQTMDEIEASSRQIAEIVTLMDGIAFQTNLLALNASVEAARAGEQGRGFAVVAGEVRQLASRSADASRQIKELIDASTAKTRSGAERVRTAGTTMDEIVASVTRVTDVLSEINAATREQSQGIGQVNQAVADLDRMTQQNAAMVEQTATAAEELKAQAQRLAEVVGTFTLRRRSEAPAPYALTSGRATRGRALPEHEPG